MTHGAIFSDRRRSGRPYGGVSHEEIHLPVSDLRDERGRSDRSGARRKSRHRLVGRMVL